jgi:hypothetical protein
VRTARDYLSLTLDVNFRWNWRDEGGEQDSAGEPRLYVNPTQNVADAMVKHPRMRVLLVGGYYDMAVPVLAPRYALTHTNVPLDRLTTVALAAPHSSFQGDTNLTKGSAVVHDFLKGASAACRAASQAPCSPPAVSSRE